jgi:PST family polysaccharide transporter
MNAVPSKVRLEYNLLVMVMWQVGNYLVPMLTFPYLTHILGPTHFGLLGYATSIAVYGSLLTDWGFNLSGPRALIECRGDKREINELIWSVVFAKALLCILSLLALCLAFQFHWIELRAMPLILIAWTSVAGSVFTLSWVLQGLERFSQFAVVSLAGRFLTLPFVFLFVKSADDVGHAIAIQSVAPVATGVFSMLMVRKIGLLHHPAGAWRLIGKRLSQSADMFLSTVSVSLFGVANIVLLGAASTPDQVGLYAAADRIKTMGNMVPTQINTVFYPRVSAIMLSDTRAAAKLTLRGIGLTFGVTILGVVVVYWASTYITQLILGEAFIGAAPLLIILCTAALFSNVAYTLGLQVLMPFGFGKARSFTMLLAGALNVGLTYRLIPKCGARGAALSFLIAEAAIFFVFLAVIVGSKRTRGHFTQFLDGKRNA